jgi:hypothetical protein
MSKITDYFSIEKYLAWRFLLLVSGGVLVIIPAALALGKGLLSPRGLALVMIAYVGCVAVAVFIILRNARARFQASSGKSTDIADDATREKFRKRIRRLQFGVAFFALVLVYAEWESRGEPWQPRLIGAAINVLIQIAMIQSIRRMQRQLKQEASDQLQ